MKRKEKRKRKEKQIDLKKQNWLYTPLLLKKPMVDLNGVLLCVFLCLKFIMAIGIIAFGYCWLHALEYLKWQQEISE